MARLFARIAALVLGVSAFAGAHAQSYTYTFYLGNKLIPGGCTISTPAGSVQHVKWRLQATVTAGVTPQFGTVKRSHCVLGNFTPAITVASTSAVGLNTGSGGADAIEVRLPFLVVAPKPSLNEVLAVVANSPSASDALIATEVTSFSAKGVTAPPAVQPTIVPTLGAGSIALLGLGLLGIGWYVLRRNRHLLLFSLLLVAGTAWAVAIVVDGQVGDWATVTPSSDPAGDVGTPGIDLVKLYVTSHGLYSYLRIDVANLQNPPVANPATATLLEDGNTTITLTGSDPGGSPLTFQIASTPTRGSLGPIVPINATSASVQYTATADEFGSDSFTFTANNGSQTSTPATAAITITPVNDAPSFSAANPPAANEGSGAQSVPGWASFDPGPTNESGQVALEYLLSAISNPGLFAVAPSVAANGTLSYTLAPNASGTSGFALAVRDNGGTANGGIDLSASQNFTITVNAVNAAPSFAGGGDVSALEDAGAQAISAWASAIDDGDPDQVQGLAFNVTANTNPSLFSAGPAVDPISGTLTYTIAADANGSAQITLTLSDDGGTANGGSNTSSPYLFTVQVGAVNDAPTFTAVDPAAVNEGSGAQTVVNWASFDPGPANESAQVPLEYLVSAIGNPALFAVAPSVAANGMLTYTVAPDVSGSSTFSVAVRDDGGIANGGVDLSASQTFTVTVNAVNSAPSFVGGGDVSSAEDAGPQSVAGWATAIDDGDPEVQALTFNVTGNTNPGLFAVGPVVDPVSGDLDYTAANNASGSATITLTLGDDGGTANGGSDTSAPYSFTITVNASNDAPTATAKSHTTHSAIELEIIAASHSGELLEGAADPDDPVGDLTAEFIAGSATPAAAVVVVTNASDGSFRYDPPGGYSGAGSFQYRVCDDGVPVAPPQCSAATTVTFNITGPELHFVDDSAAPGGDGGLNDPFDSLSDLSPGRGTGDRIYLHEGTYATAHSIQADEHLIGQGHGGSSAAHLGVVAVGNGVLDTTPAAGAAPSVTNTISFAGSNGLLRGVSIDSGSNTAVTAGAVSGITVGESSLIANTTAASFNGTDASAAGVVFTSTTSSGGVNGIVLNNITDTFDFGAGSLSGHGGVSFLGTGTLGTTSYAGTISKSSAGNIVELNGAAASGDTGTVTLSGALSCSGCGGIDVVNRDVGTITFSGATKTLSTGASAAVNLDNNDTASIHFTAGGLDIDTTSGPGFNAVNGAVAITVQTGTNGNTIDSGTGTALTVASTNIGAQHLTFERISANGGANGIVLDSTGAAGGLTVTGSGGTCSEGSSTCSGGWIRNTTGGDNAAATPAGTGIALNNTSSVNLARMRISDHANYGIRGTGVNGFSLAESVIDGSNGSNAAMPFNEGSMAFFGATGTMSGMTGTSSITNSTIMGGWQRNIAIDNSVGTLDLTVSGNTIKRSSDAAGDDGFFLEADTTANVTVSITGNTFARHGGDHINLSMTNDATLTATISGNTLHGNYAGTPEGNHPIGLGQGIFLVGVAFNGTAVYDVSDNGTVAVPFRGNRQGGAIHVSKGSGSGTVSGEIQNNVIGDPAVVGSGSSEAFGIIVGARGAGGSHTTLINNNLIRQFFDRGGVLEAGEGAAALNATVTNNTVTAFADAINSLHGIHSNNGILAADTSAVCLHVSGNSVGNAGNEPQGGADLRLRRGSATTVRLPGVAGATNANATTLWQANNPTATTISITGNGYSSGAACPLP